MVRDSQLEQLVDDDALAEVAIALQELEEVTALCLEVASGCVLDLGDGTP